MRFAHPESNIKLNIFASTHGVCVASVSVTQLCFAFYSILGARIFRFSRELMESMCFKNLINFIGFPKIYVTRTQLPLTTAYRILYTKTSIQVNIEYVYEICARARSTMYTWNLAMK